MEQEKGTKVMVLLQSVKDAKAKYIEILSKDDETIMKIKLTIDDVDMVDLLDGFYDNGFKVKKISKQDFDDYNAEEKLSFNI